MSHLINFDLIILFFVLGVFASWIGSDLEIPDPISKFLSIFLLLSLGLKGGHEVRMADQLTGFLPALSLGLASCIAIPLTLFFLLKNRMGIVDASALSASYGSVSAVTFITAQSILVSESLAPHGYFVAIMALMEVPAILLGVFLFQKFSIGDSDKSASLLRSILSTKSFVLLLGGFLIGFSMNQNSWNGISPVIQGCFKGVLAFFLLDLGIIAQKQFDRAWQFKKVALFTALFAPLFFGSLFLFAGIFSGLSQGDQVLLAVLAGSASYIAAPAAIRSAIPGANPGLYLAMPLAITFPMNLLLGIPLYIELSRWLGE